MAPNLLCNELNNLQWITFMFSSFALTGNISGETERLQE